MIRVFVVEDHPIVRDGLRRVLDATDDIQVVGEAANSVQACECALALDPQVVVMDIALPGVSGIEAMRRILAHRPQQRVLMFSMYDDVIYPSRALEAGALGYVSKASAPEVLVDAISAVARGERYLSPDVAKVMSMQARSMEIRPTIGQRVAATIAVPPGALSVPLAARSRPSA